MRIAGPGYPLPTDRLSVPLFQDALAADWDALAPEVQRFHGGEGRYRGLADIDRGQSPGAWLVARLFGFPPAGRDVPVEVTVTVRLGSERWTRKFGKHVFHSQITPGGPRAVCERLGIATFGLDLQLEESGLRLSVRSGRVGPLPIPRVLLPQTQASERGERGRFWFDIALEAPVIGRIVHYRGWLEPAEIAAEAVSMPQRVES